MLIKNLSFEAVPFVEFSDPVYRVLELMQDNGMLHIVVQHEEKFAGLVAEDALLEIDEDIKLGELQYLLKDISVKEDDHFLKAVSLAASNNISIIPLVDAAGNLAGTLHARTLLKHVAEFMHLKEAGAMVVLEVDPQQYSFSEINKIIETNDAQITQLNTSHTETGAMQVTIKLNKLEVSDIVSTFQRYEYNIRYYSGEELYTNELKSNYENLMNYLNI